MNSRRVVDLANDRTFPEIDNDNLRRVRELKAIRRRIDCQNIPAAFTTDWDLA